MKQERRIKITPDVFINPPYIKCPKCGKNTFGVLMICDEHYVRRCKNCFYPKANEAFTHFPLPKITKKILYLDQFVVSNMMIALNPKTKGFSKVPVNSFWLKLFNKLDRLSKLQLIICPDSSVHEKESLLSPFNKSLKRMYEYFSNGVGFEHSETIKKWQIVEYARNWIKGKKDKEIDLHIKTAVRKDVNAWQERYHLSLNLNYEQSEIDASRVIRKRISEALNGICERWKREKHRTFNEWYDEELRGIGEGIWEIYFNYLRKYALMSNGLIPFNINECLPPTSTDIVYMLKKLFIESGINERDVYNKIKEFLISKTLSHVPYINISAMLFAALARKYSLGRKQPFSPSFTNDVEAISTLLPYCDAMFVDKEMFAYLTESPGKNKLHYDTKIFSLSNQDNFIEYLNKIEENTSEKHFDLVCQVYGKDWIVPYTTIYK